MSEKGNWRGCGAYLEEGFIMEGRNRLRHTHERGGCSGRMEEYLRESDNRWSDGEVIWWRIIIVFYLLNLHRLSQVSSAGW